MLDSNEPYQAKHTQEPSVAIETGNESVNPTALTTVIDQQTNPLNTQSVLNQPIQTESERVGLKRPSNICVDEETALPDPKRQKILTEATVNVNPIHLTKPNTPSPSNIIEEELTVNKRGDTDSQSQSLHCPTYYLTRASNSRS